MEDLELIKPDGTSVPLFSIAEIIKDDWKHYGTSYAKPYIQAMSGLSSIENMFFEDSGNSIVAYFLSNASSWRGPKAKAVKAHLKALLKGTIK